MVDLAGALGIFGALDGECHPARRAELIAGVLLVCREAPAGLIRLGCGGSGNLNPEESSAPIRSQSMQRLTQNQTRTQRCTSGQDD